MTEINETDVMLGDWVLYEHKNTRWETVSTHCLKVENIARGCLCMRNGDYARVQYTGIRGIKPIPLTKDILEKNGCDYNVGPGGLFQINIKGLNCHISFNIIRYVHELQHALRLCGVKKELIL